MPKIVDKDKKRREILAGATDVFAARGYHNTRMADVAEALGVSKGLLYEYFHSKEDLFLNLCREIVPWAELGEDEGEPDAQALVELIAEVAASYDRSRDFFLILSDFWSTVTRGAPSQRKAFLQQGATFYQTPRMMFTRLITRGQSLGTFRRDVDPAILANVIIAGIEGVRMQHMIDAKRSHKNAVLAELARMAVRELAGEDAVADYGVLAAPGRGKARGAAA